MDRVRTLTKLASELNRHARATAPANVPSAFLFTDERMTCPLEQGLASLPRGTGVIFRHYDTANRADLAHRVSDLCRTHGLSLLTAGDPVLARRCKAQGVHLPGHMLSRIGPLRIRHPDHILSCACHSLKDLFYAEQHGADLAFLSPLFPTRSHAGARGMGAARMASLTRSVRLPVYGLGGINEKTARRLRGTGLAGIGAIDGWFQSG